MLARYQALPDDMKAALKPRLLPARAPAEPAPAGESGTGSPGFRLEPAPGSRYEPGDAPAAAPALDTAPAGRQGSAPPTEPPPGSPEYQAGNAQARSIAEERAAEGADGQGSAPLTEPPSGSPGYQTADAELRYPETERQIDQIETERMITQWMKGAQSELGGPPDIPTSMPPELAQHLDPEHRQEIENLLTKSTESKTDLHVFEGIFQGLTSSLASKRIFLGASATLSISICALS